MQVVLRRCWVRTDSQLFLKRVNMMKNSHCCPKSSSTDIRRIPDNGRYASGNNIYTTTITLFGKIPVIRYVCCNCGYVENWVEKKEELDKIRSSF